MHQITCHTYVHLQTSVGVHLSFISFWKWESGQSCLVFSKRFKLFGAYPQDFVIYIFVKECHWPLSYQLESDCSNSKVELISINHLALQSVLVIFLELQLFLFLLIFKVPGIYNSPFKPHPDEMEFVLRAVKPHPPNMPKPKRDSRSGIIIPESPPLPQTEPLPPIGQKPQVWSHKAFYATGLNQTSIKGKMQLPQIYFETWLVLTNLLLFSIQASFLTFPKINIAHWSAY